MKSIDIKMLYGPKKVVKLVREAAEKVQADEYYGERLMSNSSGNYFTLINTLVQEFGCYQLQLKVLVRLFNHANATAYNHDIISKLAANWLLTASEQETQFYTKLSNGELWNCLINEDFFKFTGCVTLEYLVHEVTEYDNINYSDTYKARYIDYDLHNEKETYLKWKESQNSNYVSRTMRRSNGSTISPESVKNALMGHANRIAPLALYGEHLLVSRKFGFTALSTILRNDNEDGKLVLKILVNIIYHTPTLDEDYSAMATRVGTWLQNLSLKSVEISEKLLTEKYVHFFTLKSHDATVVIRIFDVYKFVYQDLDGAYVDRSDDFDVKFEKNNSMRKYSISSRYECIRNIHINSFNKELWGFGEGFTKIKVSNCWLHNGKNL